MTVDTLPSSFNYHHGPLAIPNAEELAFIETRLNKTASDDFPDMELFFVGGSYISNPVNQEAFGINDDVGRRVYEPLETRDT